MRFIGWFLGSSLEKFFGLKYGVRMKVVSFHGICVALCGPMKRRSELLISWHHRNFDIYHRREFFTNYKGGIIWESSSAGAETIVGFFAHCILAAVMKHQAALFIDTYHEACAFDYNLLLRPPL